MNMITPLDDRLILQKAAAKEKTAGGLLIPDSVDQEPMEGVVVAAGPGKTDTNGNRIPLVVKIGDRVLYGKWSIKDIQLDGEKDLAVIREEEIIGILTEK